MEEREGRKTSVKTNRKEVEGLGDGGGGGGTSIIWMGERMAERIEGEKERERNKRRGREGETERSHGTRYKK